MRMKPRRVILWVVIIGLLIFNARQFPAWARSVGIPLYDYLEYWSAGRVFLEGKNPYGDRELLQVQRAAGWTDSSPVMMWNPPWTLLIISPFSLLPYWASRSAWFFMHIVIVFGVADFLWRFYGGPASHRWISALTALFFVPNVMALYLGQITTLVLAGVAGFLWAVDKRQLVLAGCFLFLVALKPQVLYLFWIFLVLWIMRQRQWRVAAAAGATLLVSNLIIGLRDPSIYRQYLAGLGSDIGPMMWATPTWGTALRLLLRDHDSWPLQVLPCLLGCLIAAWLWQRWRDSFSWRDSINPILLISIITSSFTWMFDWVLLLPTAIFIMVRFQAQPLQRWQLFLWLTVFQAVTILQTPIIGKGFSWLWMPVALAILYYFGASRPIASSDSKGHLA